MPAKTRTPPASPPCGSFTRNGTDAPPEKVQTPSWRGAPLGSGAEKAQSRTYSSSVGTNCQSGTSGVGLLSGRTLKRYNSPSENRSDGLAMGSVLTTSTRRSDRSGLGKAYTSVMSAIGSARARGPEMWSDIVGRSPSSLPTG